MTDATEYLLETCPLTVRRRVLWGECDPAGVVYTPRFAEYAASARDYWMRHIAGYADRPAPGIAQVVFPMRAMQFDFRGMLRPDDHFNMVVTLAEVRTRSFSLQIAATNETGQDVFVAQLSHVAFDQAIDKAVTLPEPLAMRLREIMAG